MPWNVLEGARAAGGNTTYILIKLAPAVAASRDTPPNIESVRREIARRLPHNDVHTRAEWAARSRRHWIETTGLGLNLGMTVLLGCLVGVVVVAQTLYTSTMEHLKEFGTVKAIGGSNRDIYVILGKQAAIAAVVGFLLGAAQAYLLRPLLARIDLKLIVSPQFAALVFAGTLVLCLAAAAISFRSILGCILTPSGGRVVVNGEQIDPRHPQRLPAIRKRSIGFAFQQFNLFPALTARENVEYALNIKGRRGREARRQAERALDEVGLADRRDFLPRDLSGGQKQRVAIARALSGEPAILLADEPTANLDSAVGTQVLELFRDLAKRDDRALLIVTHDPKVRAIADRVVQIRDGRLAA